MGTINEVLRAARKRHRLHPMLWRFSQLADSKWSDASVADAAQAQVVVLASTSASTLTPELESWIARFLAQRRGRRTTLVALLGPDDAWTITIEEPRIAAVSNSEPIAEQRLVA